MGDFIAMIGKEKFFEPLIGQESLHQKYPMTTG